MSHSSEPRPYPLEATRAGHELGAAGEPRAAAPDAIAAEVETQRLLAARLVLTADEPAFVWPDMDAPETLAQVELGAAALVSTRQRGLQLGFGPAADGRFALVGLRPGVRLTLEVQDAADRPLVVRSTMLNAGEWQQLELALD